MRVAIYVRVSTEDQAREGYSLDAQEKRLRSYCTLRDKWEIVDTYRDEGYSGRNPNRPEYQRMLSELDRWDVILVLKMDRIHRNSVNFTQMMDYLNKNGKNFYSMMDKFDTTTAMGRFVMDIIQRMAQLESEQIGERVKFAMTKKAKSGDAPMGSGDPYGYRHYNGELVIIDAEAENVRRIYDEYCCGRSTEAIARALNDDGVPSKKGAGWSRQAVWKILHNPLYAGYLRWADQFCKSKTPGIITEEQFIEVNGALK